MAEKKSKVKAHRGFAHVRLKPKRPTGDPAPKRPIGRPQRPYIPRLPRGPRRPNFSNQQLQQMSDAQLRRYFNAQRRRSIAQQLSPQNRIRFFDQLNRANLSPAERRREISRYRAFMSNLRKGLDASGKPIPTGKDTLKMFRKAMEQDRKRLQQMKKAEYTPTQKQIEEARRRFQKDLRAAMGNKKQTTAPAQQALTNPNRRRPMTADQRQRMIRSQNTRVAKGGTVRKKK